MLKSSPYRTNWSVEISGYQVTSRISVLEFSKHDLPKCMEWESGTYSTYRTVPDEYLYVAGNLRRFGGPWVVPDRSPGKHDGAIFYDPMEKRDLHRVFASLDGSPTTIVEFANHYGLLGAYFEIQKFENPPYRDFAEPLEFWRGEIAKMGNLLDLLEQSKDEQLAKAHLETVIQSDLSNLYQVSKDRGIDYAVQMLRAQSTFEIGEYVAESVEETEDGFALPPDFIYSEISRLQLQTDLNKMLSLWVRPTVIIERGTSLFLRPKNLLGAMYALLAEEIIGGAKVMKKCLACGKWFKQIDPRKTTCSNKCRQKLWRDANKSLKKENQNG